MVTWCISDLLSYTTLEPGAECQMLRWLIPHLPIQASTLAAKSKPVVVYTLDMDLVLMILGIINWICVVVYVFCERTM